MDCLQRFVVAEGVHAAQLTAIGAFSDVVLLYFDWEKKDYLRIPVREQVEVASLVGDVARRRQASRRFTSTSWWVNAMAARWQGTWARHMSARRWK